MVSGPTKLAAEIKRRKVSQTDVAKTLKVSRPCVSQILSRQRRPSLDLAALIQRKYGVPATDFAEVRDA